MFNFGTGVKQDYEKAFTWYKKAAEQGDAAAQFILGSMYYNGSGVTKDYKLAYVWGSLAAEQGHEQAIKDRYILLKKLSPQQLEEARAIEETIRQHISTIK